MCWTGASHTKSWSWQTMAGGASATSKEEDLSGGRILLRQPGRRVVLTATVALGLLAGGLQVPVGQATLVLDLNTGATAASCGGGGSNGTTFGWAFTVLNVITVDGLGVWDARSDGDWHDRTRWGAGAARASL